MLDRRVDGHRFPTPWLLAAATALVVAGTDLTGTAVASAAVPAAAPALAPQSGITASVGADGSYQIRTEQPAAWTFSGTVGHPVTSQSTTSGSDAVGAYQQTAFSYTDGVNRSASIRVYQDTPVVLFAWTTQAQSANGSAAAFPTLATPGLPYRESFRDTAFATYQFGGTVAHDSPLMSFDGSNRGFLISAADNFAVSNLTLNGATVSAGIASGVPSLPAGFTHRTVLALGSGVNNTYATWGNALLALGGKHRIANDADATLNKLGYWTDNGASYYYRYDSARGYAGTLQAVAQDFASRGVPLGYLQLDSWWYPKGSSASWQGNGTNRGGEYLYRAAPALFPTGLAAFQRQLGLPLVTHARWIDTASPYQKQYAMSGGVSTDPAFWTDTMSYLAGAGVATYEQDWLSENAQPRYNLTDPGAFLGNMAHSAAADNISVQYCMPLPWNYLQSSMYQNVRTSRVSNDRFNRNSWDQFLFASRLASALGEWPWTDVFMSKETTNLLLSTLSGGMVGVGDAIGAESTTNLRQAVRGDGVIVKPDAPVVPLDSVYSSMGRGGTPPMVAATYSDHGGLRAGYVFAYARNNGTQSVSFSPAEVGVPGTAYVYDYFTGSGTLVPAGGRYTATVGTGSYYVVVPVGSSGIGFLGDSGKFVSLGSKRITQLSDTGSVHATVAFAAGESRLTLHGYAPSAPSASATDGAVAGVQYNATTRQFTLTVTAGADHAAAITLSRA